VPRLFVSERERLVVHLARADGIILWADTLNARELGTELAPSTPSGGWSTGRYRLEIIPGAGADTIAKRIFEFALVGRR